MAVVACDLFSQPAPEILNRIVGTIGRQRDESETEFGGGSHGTWPDARWRRPK